jgi:Flp pilus assembly protein TadB
VFTKLEQVVVVMVAVVAVAVATVLVAEEQRDRELREDTTITEDTRLMLRPSRQQNTRPRQITDRATRPPLRTIQHTERKNNHMCVFFFFVLGVVGFLVVFFFFFFFFVIFEICGLFLFN